MGTEPVVVYEAHSMRYLMQIMSQSNTWHDDYQTNDKSVAIEKADEHIKLYPKERARVIDRKPHLDD